MPVELEPILESLEGQPEYFKEIYAEVDGKYILNGKIEEHPKVASLKKAYTEDHKKVRALNDEVKKFSGVDLERWAKIKDLDDESLAAFTAWREDKEKAAANGNGATAKPSLPDEEFQQRVERLTKKWEAREAALLKENTDLKGLIDKTTSQLHERTVRTALLNACSKAGILAGAVEDAMNMGMQVCRLNEEGDVVIVGKDGHEILGADLKPMGPEEWLASKAQEKAHWWPRNSGGGAGGGKNGDFSFYKTKTQFPNVAAKVAYIQKHGRAAYEALPVK